MSTNPVLPTVSPMLLVHRPGRATALVAAGVFIVLGVLLYVFQFATRGGQPWLNLLLIGSIVVGFWAIMRAGTTRCEIEVGQERLLIRSVDSSRLLGRTREVVYRWAEVRDARWMSADRDQLRLDFATAPRALVFGGARRDLDALHDAVKTRSRTNVVS